MDNEPKNIRVKRNSVISVDYVLDTSPSRENPTYIQKQSIVLGMYNGFMSKCWKVDTDTSVNDCYVTITDTVMDDRRAKMRLDRDMLDNLITLLQRARFHLDASNLEARMRNEE